MRARDTAAQIEDQASRWAIRIDKEGRHPALTAELDAWLAGDRRRAGALLQAESAWLLLDRLNEQDLGPDARTQEGVGNETVWHTPRIGISRRNIMAGGATALAASVIGGIFLINAPERIQTSIGEIRRVPLADGSTTAINTNSQITVALAPKRRLIRIEEGEAWFQVAKDKARPFVVEAGRVRVRALGTAFSVRRREAGADILVTEGVVEAWADGAEGHIVRLSAGEQAYVADNAAITRTASAPSDIDRTLSWRAGKLDLSGEPLAQAVAEFNRYNRRQIRIEDSDLAGERFYGMFRTDDPEGFVRAVEHSLGVSVDFSQHDEIRIGHERKK